MYFQMYNDEIWVKWYDKNSAFILQYVIILLLLIYSIKIHAVMPITVV